MAYRRGRRRQNYNRARTRRTLETVRSNGILTLNDANNARVIDLLALAQSEDSNLYQKDLTPSSVAGVRGHYTWYAPAGSTSTIGYLGVGLIVESARWWNIINEQVGTGDTLENIEGGMSPLDARGRYQHWHYRDVSFIANPGEAGFPAHKQLRDNRRSIRPRTSRRIPTVDDSYYLYVDSQLMNTVTVCYELTIFLRK